ncbi:hypothetical protein [Candidatus Poriferisodalis sp.]|uniref:hypothetical protein n=1 Tax=Candidatus Poriferisodalis sp. TaxID=3101277 RepID=UPI003B02B097
MRAKLRLSRVSTARLLFMAVCVTIAAVLLWPHEDSEPPSNAVVRAGVSGEHSPAQLSAGAAPDERPAVVSAEFPDLEGRALQADADNAVPKAEGGDAEGGDAEMRESPERQAESPSPAVGDFYTWHDGDRVLRVQLEPEWEVQHGARDGSENSSGAVTQGDAVEQGQPMSPAPVFRSESGEMMTLPGGVLLLLDPGWDEASVDDFFTRNGISSARVAELDYVDNGFFIETDPGFPSLNLANLLAAQIGVELSSPNWQTEYSLK